MTDIELIRKWGMVNKENVLVQSRSHIKSLFIGK